MQQEEFAKLGLVRDDLFGVVEQPGVSLGLDLLDHGGAFLGGGSLHYNPSFSCEKKERADVYGSVFLKQLTNRSGHDRCT